ncbi:hypothetical protein ALC57_07588 [Trachymyrmex cornetzi]|uniref:Uncharacterized protein n=1 Tax=Trachymyrmex cornetzi TaxID=471704 RepID=A0A151J7V6_9HYME|nr:hypothetical protein ALC57_07588 [Trachymyrmex cornetzi]
MKNKFTQTYLINCVLGKFIDSNNLFLNLKEHSHDQNPLENHIIHLMKAIISKYIKIRLYHIGKQTMKNVQSQRHFRHKLTLFQGQ